MKFLFFFLSLISLLLLSVNCNGQPKSNYEIYGTTVSTATNYLFFLEKKSEVEYKLVQGMDYLSPDVSGLLIGSSATPSFTVNLLNDGSEYTVGIVAVNSAGYYSGMGVAVGVAGVVPPAPAGIGLRKK